MKRLSFVVDQESALGQTEKNSVRHMSSALPSNSDIPQCDRGQEETSHAWLDYACVATVKVLRDVLTRADRDKRKLLKFAGG